MKRSRQEKIDKIMCKPGYTWNETVKRCLGPAGGGQKAPDTPEIPQNPGDSAPSAGESIAMEAYQRQSQGLQSK